MFTAPFFPHSLCDGAEQTFFCKGDRWATGHLVMALFFSVKDNSIPRVFSKLGVLKYEEPNKAYHKGLYWQ